MYSIQAAYAGRHKSWAGFAATTAVAGASTALLIRATTGPGKLGMALFGGVAAATAAAGYAVSGSGLLAGGVLPVVAGGAVGVGSLVLAANAGLIGGSPIGIYAMGAATLIGTAAVIGANLLDK